MDFDEHGQQPRGSWRPAPGVPMPVGELEAVSPPRRYRPRLWGAAVALLVVVIAAVAVTTTGSHTQFSVVVFSGAVARTTGSGTASVSAVETVTLGGVATELLSVDASEDYARKVGTATISDRGGNTVETVRSVGGVTYVSIPLVALPNGAHWVSITPADAIIDPTAESTIGSTDPGSGLDFFSAVAGDPRVVDRRPLDGVDVTHYAFTVDLRAYIDRARQSMKALNVPMFGAAIEKVESLVDLTKLPGEAWIDGRGRVRRFALTIEVASGGQRAKAVTELRFSHFDEPVAVTAPAASDTVPFRQVPNFLSGLAQRGAVVG
jgi:hypothetical protein